MKTIRRHDAMLLTDEGVERDAPGKAPRAFRIWRGGENAGVHGRTLFSARSVALLQQEQAVMNRSYSFDMDHMSLSESAPIENHVALGWHTLGFRQGEEGVELWAENCEWTPFATQALEAKPPQIRYYSPAYDIDPMTKEVVSYINCSLTNNPATYNLTILATMNAKRTQGERIMAGLSKAALLSAIKHLTTSDSPEVQSVAAMLHAMAEEPEKDKPADAPAHKEPDGDEGKDATKCADGEGEPDGDEKDAAKASRADTDEEKAEDARKDTVSMREHLAVLARVHSLESEARQRKTDARRAELIAKRPDLSAEIVAQLQKASMPEVEFAVRTFPRTNTLASATTVQATRGATQQDTRTPQLPPEQKRVLDAAMGLDTQIVPLRWEGKARVFDHMTREQASAFLATKGQSK